MAEVSNLHLPHEPTIMEPDAETLDSLTHWCTTTTSTFDPDSDYASDSDPFSPYHYHPHHSETLFSAHLRSDSDSHSNSDSGSVIDVNSFVEDLFQHHRSGSGSESESEQFRVMEDRDLGLDPFPSDLGFRFFDGGDEIVVNGADDDDQLGLGLGFGIEFDGPDFDSGFGDSSSILGPNSPNSHREGLRVVGIESDSDSDSEVSGDDLNSMDYGDDIDGSDRGVGDLELPLCWDCLHLEDQIQRTANEDFDWEEVDGRVDEREGSSMVIDEVEELSVSSEISDEGATDEFLEAAARNLEWEVLLAVNNLDRNPDLEHDGDVNSYLTVQDDYIYAEYETLFGQFVDNESALKGSPPAAKTIVDNLPVVVLTQQDLQKDNVVCAVCKDEVLLEEKMKKLPCGHYYHGDCIVPWLSIRNTCPVCRFELPTDDPDYERRKNQRAGHDLSPDLPVRYNFELFP